jgi:hypothetical protein
MGEAHGEIGATGLSEDERIAEVREQASVFPDEPADQVDTEQVVENAEERIDDIEEEFGPNPPRRGATPDNPNAEEAPS